MERGEHVLFREYAFVMHTARNRAAFVKALWAAYKPLAGAEGAMMLTSADLHALVALLCPDFPLRDIANAVKLVLADGMGRGARRWSRSDRLRLALAQNPPICSFLSLISPTRSRFPRTAAYLYLPAPAANVFLCVAVLSIVSPGVPRFRTDLPHRISGLPFFPPPGVEEGMNGWFNNGRPT